MVIGHTWATELGQRQLQHDRFPQSLLIVGPPQVGKSTLARYFMQMLSCTEPEKPCGTCLACHKVLNGNHPDNFLVDDDTQRLKIEAIRELQHTVALSPMEGHYRVVVLCNFETATIGAANALLKTLEEPPSYVVMILTAVDTSILLPTIVSRCQVINLRPLQPETVMTALQNQWDCEPEKAKLLTQLAGGRLGWAVRAMEDEDFLARRQQRLQDFLSLLSAHRADRLAYAHTLSQDVSQLKETLIFWLTLSRDLLLLQNNCATAIINVDWQEALTQQLDHFTLPQLHRMIILLRQAFANLDRNVNPRLNTEVTLLKLPKR